MRIQQCRQRSSSVLKVLGVLVLSPIAWSQASIPDDVNATDELLRIQQQQQEAYGVLNQANPLSKDFRPKGHLPMEGSFIQGNPPQNSLNHPLVQAFLKLMANPAFSSALEQVIKNPDRESLFFTEIAWTLIFFIFRTWRLSQLEGTRWIQRLFLKCWSSLLFIGVSTLGIPSVYLGKPYFFILQSLYQTMRHL